MPSRRSLETSGSRGMPPMPPGPSGDALPMTPLAEAQLCEHAVQAIWRSLEERDLVDEHVREDLANVLEPLTALDFGERPLRLIRILRLPDPIAASHLYWLTRRLLTLVPELQAAAAALKSTGGGPRPFHA
jgi:hypothetical protein